MFNASRAKWFPLLPTLLLGCALGALAAPEAFEVAPERTGELPRGREADGIAGDFILRNDKIVAVISGNLPQRRANMGTFYGPDGITPGCLYDLTLREINNDQITVFAPAGQRGAVSWVRVLKDGSDGEASVETVVSAASNRGIFRRHEYRLRDGWQGLEIVTTLRNESARAQKVGTEDRWTVFLRTGQAFGITWADAVDPDDKTGYAFAVLESDAALKPGEPVELQPGQTVRFTRFLAVGRSPAEALGLVAERRGRVGRVAGRLVDRNGAPVTTGDLLIRSAGSTNVLCVAHPDTHGQVRFALPEGDYEIEITDLGRAAVTRSVTVKAGETASLDATLAVAAAVEFDIRDDSGRSLPCKAQFRGIGGTPTPSLGPSARARGSVDQYHSETGRFRVALPPGQYAIIVTRGIEYSHLSNTVVLQAEQTVAFRGVLRRLVDTTGWISADYHNHSTLSGDNVCGTDDRVINLAAEHIEFAPTTEHNRFYDWRPHIEKLGLTNDVQTVCGIELTGSGPHLNAFPFRVVPFTQDNGAPLWHPDPRISAITLRDWQGAEPDRWVQINHPDLVHDFIDRDGDGRADGGFHGL
ncbi:MAG: carboxypeptidase regulatory-like domain-containing protein, partial [Verrucomicrobiales bacterium]|nr:carboxypeptidase regulatory-like domain-containing protein [Verrucomicrobiales bacterium]